MLPLGFVLTLKDYSKLFRKFLLCQIGLYSLESVLSVVFLSFSAGAVSFGQTIDVQRGAALFGQACIGCHVGGGNIIQPVRIPLLMQSR